MMKAKLISVAMLALVACSEKSGRGSSDDEAPSAVSPPPSTATGSKSGNEPTAALVKEPIETLADSVEWPQTNLRARIITSKGDIVVELYANEAPKTVDNFVRYASEGQYDRLIFHRVVHGFVIQGGGYNQYFQERPTRNPIPYEGDNGLKNYRTAIAMARTSDPGSAAAQWFINLRDNNEQLDHFVNDLGPRYGYAVFGRVIEGMETVDEIGSVVTGPAGPFEAEAPQEAVTISRIDVFADGQ